MIVLRALAAVQRVVVELKQSVRKTTKEDVVKTLVAVECQFQGVSC